MRGSLALRASLAYALLVLLSVSILLVMIFENQLDLIAENAMIRSRLLGQQLGSSLMDGDLTRLDEELIDSLGITVLTVYDETGAVVRSIRQIADDEEPLGDTIDTDTLRSIGMALARRDFELRSFYHVLDYDERRVFLYVPYTTDREAVRVVRAEVPLYEIDRNLGFLYRQAVIVVVLVFILHVLWALYIYRTIVRPMRRILVATEQVSRGNFNIRVPVVQRNELGRLAGAFNEMSIAVSRIHHEALQSNPLSGLPGNPAILAEIERRLSDPIAVMYIDLDNFKAYNDRYGFSRGDEALIYTRDCLREASSGFVGSFLGHEGGDDFVVIIDAAKAEDLARRIVERFDRDRRLLFSDADWRRGYFEGHDRNGSEAIFPLLSISVAVVTNVDRHIEHAAELISIVAGVKQRIKQQEGSGYVIDRRSDEERD